MTDILRSQNALNALQEEEEQKPPERFVTVLKIKDAIERRQMTQKDLAELTDIRPNAISMLARGYVERLNLDHLQRIAAALNITDIRELVDLMPEDEARQYDYK